MRFLLLLGLFFATAAPAATIVARDVPYLTDVSDAVVHGRVRSVRYTPDDQGRMWTHTKVEIAQWWKGSGESSIEVSQLGGQYADGRVLKIEGDLQLRPGMEVVLFLTEEDGIYHSTLLSWSAFEVHRKRASVQLKRNGGQMHAMARDANGALGEADPSILAPPPSLEALRAEVLAAKETP